MKHFLAAICLLAAMTALAQNQSPPPAVDLDDGVSGMYTFLREGEFVEVDLEDKVHITGFVSRYGESDSDRGAFLDHMIDKGEFDRPNMHWITKPIHGVWFEFKGRIERGEAKSPNLEGYRVLKGTLTEYTTDDNKKTSARSREVTFKSFPQDALVTPAKNKD
ncbi:MAG TPA: hypothetical protein VEG30_07775 [Terriglobales bacterium]|nr:hypothetical protein [Terriglobales bacterium]